MAAFGIKKFHSGIGYFPMRKVKNWKREEIEEITVVQIFWSGFLLLFSFFAIFYSMNFEIFYLIPICDPNVLTIDINRNYVLN